MAVAKRHQEQLERYKKNVRASYEYFKPNVDRFHKFKNFIYNSSLTDTDKKLLKELGKPEMEFNMSEAFISRLRGEFAKQEPSIAVHAAGTGNVDNVTREAIEGITRDILFNANHNSFEYELYTDMLSGGYSTAKVWTDYVNEISNDQVIKLGHVDPTMCGFDVYAKHSHKGDGNYCFENYIKYADEAEKEFNIKLDGLQFTQTENGFDWSYKTETAEKVIVVCDFYEKTKKEAKTVRLSNGQDMLLKDYEEFEANWRKKYVMQPPIPVRKPRDTLITVITRSRLIENQVIEHVEMDYRFLPLIFFDGNSAMLKNGGTRQQMTKPYLYHAYHQQRMINFAGQTWGAELENMTQAQWVIAIESIPDHPDYREAIMSNQAPANMLYNVYADKTTEKPLPAPVKIPRPNLPVEVINTFASGQQVLQSILGNYDAQLGIQNNELSGVALEEAATQSNAAAMPYIKGFLQGLNQVAQVIVDLIPKYYTTPRTMPITGKDGKRTYMKVNQPGGVQLDYDSNDLEVKVDAGVNFNVQKSRTLAQITALSQAMPIFGQFMNVKGLKTIVKNLEGHAMDELEELADEFMQELKQQQAAQQGQPNPQAMDMMVKQKQVQNEAAKLQLEMQKFQADQQQTQAANQLEQSKIMNDANSNVNAYLKIQHVAQQNQFDRQQAGVKDAIEMNRAKAEEYNDSVQLALNAQHKQTEHALALHDQLHQHAKENQQLINETASVQNQIKQLNKPRKPKKPANEKAGI
jgi:hypothetical protein